MFTFCPQTLQGGWSQATEKLFCEIMPTFQILVLKAKEGPVVSWLVCWIHHPAST